MSIIYWLQFSVVLPNKLDTSFAKAHTMPSMVEPSEALQFITAFQALNTPWQLIVHVCEKWFQIYTKSRGPKLISATYWYIITETLCSNAFNQQAMILGFRCSCSLTTYTFESSINHSHFHSQVGFNYIARMSMTAYVKNQSLKYPSSSISSQNGIAKHLKLLV